MTTWHWIGLACGLVLLNLSLTFGSVWPTLGIRLTGDLSIELAAVALAVVLAWRWIETRSRGTLRWLAALWVVLVVGRYADITARSLYGRDINLFWDLRHMPNVGAMFAAVADPWLRIGLVAGVLVIPVVLYVTARWALARLVFATFHALGRGVLGVAAGGVLLLGVTQGMGAEPAVRLAEPVTPAFAEELGELVYEMSGAGVRSLSPPPSLSSDLSRLDGADVFVVFLESYGMVSWDRPEFAAELVDARTRLAADIGETGRSVVSARVESTTFGGESWLAHISLLSGTEVRDPGTNKRLLGQERDTLVKVFGRRGYRTVAVMPGLQHAWPQGAFYGFDEIYDLERIDYQGPLFGWWGLNDQFTLARIDALEVAARPRRPVFVFFPTVTTHAPFVPTPPYQPDWARVLTPSPYDRADLDRAWLDYPDWLNLAPSYVKALAYAYQTVGGYLRFRAERDFVLVLVGDHQPPALVSGEDASWDVPVHIVASRAAVLDRLRRHHFVDGLVPPSQTMMRIDTLLPILLDAFGTSADGSTSPGAT